jgi:hypothetical protein
MLGSGQPPHAYPCQQAISAREAESNGFLAFLTGMIPRVGEDPKPNIMGREPANMGVRTMQRKS